MKKIAAASIARIVFVGQFSEIFWAWTNGIIHTINQILYRNLCLMSLGSIVAFALKIVGRVKHTT
jgi:hypothetical protein